MTYRWLPSPRRLAASLALASVFIASAAHANESEVAAARAKRAHFGGKISVLGGYGRIHTLPFYGVGLRGEIGVDNPGVLGFYAGLSYERMRTEYGLPVHYGNFTLTLEGILGIVRIGGGVHLSYFSMERVSEDATLDRFGPGIHLSGSIDFVQTDEFSLYLQLRPQIDILRSWVPNAHAAVGVRF